MPELLSPSELFDYLKLWQLPGEVEGDFQRFVPVESSSIVFTIGYYHRFLLIICQVVEKFDLVWIYRDKRGILKVETELSILEGTNYEVDVEVEYRSLAAARKKSFCNYRT